MIIVNNIKLNIEDSQQKAFDLALKTAQLSSSQVKEIFVHKVSVDARRGVQFVYSVGIELADKYDEQQVVKAGGNVVIKPKENFTVSKGVLPLAKPPVVCGLGPAGLFCGLVLARQGFRPIILEQGQDIDTRTKTVAEFEKTGKLHTKSNIQFGEGGAGTFSDGKLTTRIGDARCEFVTDTLIEFGAPKEIRYAAKPHIGTDLLTGIIKNIRQEIVRLGGQVLFETQLQDIRLNNEKVSAVLTDKGEIETTLLVLATGHSARETFFMLKEKGAQMSAKPFSVGVRIESLQTDIDKGLYHQMAGHPALPKGEYQLAFKNGGRGVYTFCMCPGGNVVAAASEEETVVVNGMSFHARNGKNANSALVVSVTPEDFDQDFTKAIAFQRELERKAFALGGRNYKAPAQTVGRFLQGKKGLALGKVEPTYPLGVTESDFSTLFPAHITQGLQQSLGYMNNRLKGFAQEDSVLTGVETRTSSPVRIHRNEEMESNLQGLYPCGEGAGYAGGIMSAAVDGVRVATQICQQFKGFES